MGVRLNCTDRGTPTQDESTLDFQCTIIIPLGFHTSNIHPAALAAILCRFVTTPTHQTYNRHGSWLVQTEKMPEMEDIYGQNTVF